MAAETIPSFRVALETGQDSEAGLEQFFKPLVDSQHIDKTPIPAPLRGQASRQKEYIPVNVSPPEAKLDQPKPTTMITGKVQTLQQAIQSERDIVDWYGWYLAARSYLAGTGGIHCELGTAIKFYRNGYIEALSNEPACLGSLMGRRFPLPAKTRLDALILPVRSGSGPAASREEIYSRIQGLQYQ